MKYILWIYLAGFVISYLSLRHSMKNNDNHNEFGRDILPLSVEQGILIASAIWPIIFLYSILTIGRQK